MDTLTTELLKTVTASLPQMTGDALRARLEQADKDAVKARDYDALSAEKQRLDTRNRALEQAAESVKGREEKVAQREHTLELREKLCELKEAHAKERVTEMREVVRDVFANSKFKYFDTGYNGGQSYNRSGEFSAVPESR